MMPPAFNGFKIAFLSDVHYGSAGVSAALVERALDLAMAERPDVLCFGGDLITGWSARKSLPEFLSIVRSASAPQGVFGILGNHEFNWGESGAMREFERSSIRILRNETVFLTRGRDSLPMVGLDNLFDRTWDAVRRSVSDIEKYPDCIVLEHTPDFADVLARSAFRGVLLSGHTHGGQILLPLLGQTMTASRFGLDYVAGLYPAGRGLMYVTRGVGAVLVPMRIGCPPEVTIVELSKPQRTEA